MTTKFQTDYGNENDKTLFHFLEQYIGAIFSPHSIPFPCTNKNIDFKLVRYRYFLRLIKLCVYRYMLSALMIGMTIFSV